ncbi:DUF4199 domain-containing protein [Marinigracilibium pacificum]|uniref:DUF4199 domain-containing protein n=1 Tax=Marinigracilibium pacificum TaxID=2729599 RepID=A0A848IT03_9BACT|nr:DUF4199 domain-containing protein [Marinigracilibium pacificum]NMM47593.1 DUF4199 domain-containing protein [Marinigracilibium pacificum]
MKKYSIEIKWALIFTVALIVWTYIEKITGLHSTHIDKHPIYTNLFAIIAFVIYTMALLDKRRTFYNGKMTYKQGFISGLIISIIVAILSPVSQFITHKLITPDYFKNAIEYSVSSGNVTLEEAESYFNLNSYIIQSFIFAIVVGAITSAIVAFFTKNVSTPSSPSTN